MFVLLGLALLAGGVAAIVDGWPYLLIERGFTEVIAGTILATGGIIVLVLSRLMVEIRKIAATAGLAATMQAALGPMRDGPSEERSPSLPSVAAAVVPAAAAGALLAASRERQTDETHEDVAHEDLAHEDLAHEDLAHEPAAVAPADPVVEDTWPDPAVGDLFADTPEPALTTENEPVDARTDLATDEITTPETVAAEDHPPSAASALAPAADAEAYPDDSRAATPDPDRFDEWGEIAASRPSEALPIDVDLGALRQELVAGPRPVGLEARDERDSDPVDEASAWMLPKTTRQEPVLDHAPALDDGAMAAVAAPAARWSSRFDDLRPEPDDSSLLVPHGGSAGAVAAADVAGTDLVATEVTADRGEPMPLPDADMQPEPALAPAAETSAPEAPEPQAASDEGVVAAYQVGDTHFTMFADGSIQARTPDGTYSFASMDELKVYLASEKNRLGD